MIIAVRYSEIIDRPHSSCARRARVFRPRRLAGVSSKWSRTSSSTWPREGRTISSCHVVPAGARVVFEVARDRGPRSFLACPRLPSVAPAGLSVEIGIRGSMVRIRGALSYFSGESERACAPPRGEPSGVDPDVLSPQFISLMRRDPADGGLTLMVTTVGSTGPHTYELYRSVDDGNSWTKLSFEAKECEKTVDRVRMSQPRACRADPVSAFS